VLTDALKKRCILGIADQAELARLRDEEHRTVGSMLTTPERLERLIAAASSSVLQRLLRAVYEGETNQEGMYVEAHIFGGVNFATDIKAIHDNAEEMGDNTAVLQNLKIFANQHNIPFAAQERNEVKRVVEKSEFAEDSEDDDYEFGGDSNEPLSLKVGQPSNVDAGDDSSTEDWDDV
jgi:hypothetical protein